jgi:hypothetical protein
MNGLPTSCCEFLKLAGAVAGAGRRVLRAAKENVRELFSELLEETMDFES